MTEIIEQIKEQEIKGPKGRLVEIEVFAHGALCVAVSGRCGMSLYCSNTSANQGKCSQMCRRQYKVTDISTGKELLIDNNYVMSSADLCTIGMLDRLVEAGVDVLKLEGRGRPAEYVDTVVSTYKTALETIKQGTYTSEKVHKWNTILKTVFNRGFSENFYMGKQIKEWAGVHGNKATKEKLHIGRVEHYYPKIGVAEVKVLAKDSLKIGEELIITGNKTGILKMKLENMLLDDKVIKEANQGDVITFKVPKRVRMKDMVYVFRDRKSKFPRGKEKLIAKS